MADVEKEVVVTGNEASRGASVLAVIIAAILLLILLAYLFRAELLGTGGDTADVQVNVKSN